MNNLQQIKKTSQANYKLHKFHPGTKTSSWVDWEPPPSFKPLRYHAIEEYFNRQIRKIKREGRKLEPKDLQNLINRYTKNFLVYPEDDLIDAHNRAMRNEPVEPSEQVKDNQGQREETRSNSIDDAEARKNRAREEQYRVMQQKPVKTRTEPLEAPKKQEKARPKKKAKILKFPKYPMPPTDWMKYVGKVMGRKIWKPIGRQIYRRSKRMYLKDVPNYPKETRRRGCYYFCGIEYLARMSGVDKRTVIRVLNDLAEAKLIYIRYHGFKGRGCSIIEVPPNMKLVMKWRREHKR